MITYKKSKKIMAVLLALALCCSFASCAKQEENKEGSNTESVVADGGAEENNVPETTEKTYQFDEDLNFGGYEMRVLNLQGGEGAVAWALTDLVVAEETGDVINDAIYTRSTTVEEKLGVTIKEIPSGIDPQSKAKKSVLANTDEYDVVFTYSNEAGKLASAGLYLDLYGIESLKFDEPWWDHGAIKSFELMEKLYFTTTDAHIMTNDSIWVLYFNKAMVRDLQLPDPYQLVRDNEWTMDAMLDMMRSAIADLDGDGTYSVNDRWGISSHSFATMAFLECTDSPIITKDSDGYPQLLNPSERFVNAFLKTREFLNKNNGMFLDAQGTYSGKTAEFDHPTKTFLANKSLFCSECLSHTRAFREMENDFGLLPHPKYDSSQDNYLTLMVDTTPAFGIPITNSDPERTGAFMEAMTGISATTIIPAYYETSLTHKFMRDDDSVEMLDIIRDNRVYELAIVYNWAGFYGTLQTYGFSETGTNPMSIYEKQSIKAKLAIDKTIAAFEEFDF